MEHLTDEAFSAYKEFVQTRLTDQDDSSLWVLVLETLVNEIALLEPEHCHKYGLYLQVGACSHWHRPHQTRWPADGGFAYPSGYGDRTLGYEGLPEHEASILFKWDEPGLVWDVSDEKLKKKKLICRISIPTRTAQHDQAAVHVHWSPGTPLEPHQKAMWLYGFRKKQDHWQCTASHGFPEVAN